MTLPVRLDRTDPTSLAAPLLVPFDAAEGAALVEGGYGAEGAALGVALLVFEGDTWIEGDTCASAAALEVACFDLEKGDDAFFIAPIFVVPVGLEGGGIEHEELGLEEFGLEEFGAFCVPPLSLVFSSKTVVATAGGGGGGAERWTLLTRTFSTATCSAKPVFSSPSPPSPDVWFKGGAALAR